MVNCCNEGARRMERTEQLLEIERRLVYKSPDLRLFNFIPIEAFVVLYFCPVLFFCLALYLILESALALLSLLYMIYTLALLFIYVQDLILGLFRRMTWCCLFCFFFFTFGSSSRRLIPKLDFRFQPCLLRIWQWYRAQLNGAKNELGAHLF